MRTDFEAETFATPEPRSPLSPPPRVPDHELLRLIGRGSYGEVWLARNVMGTYRAVKVVYRHTFDTSHPFEREFAGIQKFEPISRSHEGMINVLHVGRNENGDAFYYVMELADDVETGAAIDPATYRPKSIRSELARRERLPTDECLRISLSLASALGHLHQHGLIHRDLKPSNIIFVNGLPKLADIGLVSTLGDSRSFVGTEGFIPPEGPGSAQADIYSLGKVFYEMSTGKDRQEFPALPAEWLDLSHEEPQLEFHEVLLKACDGRAEARYRSAEELYAELALLQSGRSVRKLRAMERRVAVLSRVGIVAVIVAVVALAGYFLAQRQTRIERQHAQKLQHAEQLAREQLWNALLEQARANRRSGHGGRRIASLAAIEKATQIRPSLELRNEAISSLVLPDLRLEKTWSSAPQGNEGIKRNLALRPGFEQYAYIDPQSDIRICRTSDDAEIAVLPALGAHHVQYAAARFSPKGKFITGFYADRTLRIWDIDNRKVALSLLNVPNFEFTADAQQVAVDSGRNSLLFYDLSNGTVTREFPTQSRLGNPYFSPDGRLCLVLHSDAVDVFDLTSGELRRRLTHSDRVTSCVISGDSRRVLIGTGNHKLHLWQLETGELLQTMSGHQDAVVAVAFLDGTPFVASSSFDGTLRLWDARTGREILILPSGGDFLQFDAKTRRLALRRWGSMELFIYEFVSGDVVSAVHESPVRGLYNAYEVDFTPDERFAVTLNGDGVRFWDLKTRGESKFLPFSNPQSLAFDPDGKTLLVCGNGGLVRWPVAWNDDGEFTLGEQTPLLPPHNLPHPSVAHLSASGKTVAYLHGGKLHVLEPKKTFPIGVDVRFVAVSPDDRWLAAGTRNGVGITVWEIATGRRHWTKPVSNGAQVAFTPDSRWLVSGSSEEYSVWNVETGDLRFQIPRENTSGLHGILAISRDGKLLAAARTRTLIQLFELSTGKLIASLDPPDPQQLAWLEFSPTGRWLGAASGGRVTQLWDLQQLRQQLAAMQLDWN